jgi:ribosome-associated protein
MESTPVDDEGAPGVPDAGRPSKTRRKRAMHALQDLGERLLELNRDQVARVELPPAVREALEAARTITAHEARRRQMQYVGKLMRALDGDALQQAIDRATGTARQSVALMHRCERLREQLIADDAALTALLRDHPLADAQWLRAAIRGARRERTAQRPPRHARELYRWLYELLGGAPGAAPEGAAE